MISARRTPGGVIFEGELPPGVTAFVDSDWILGDDAGTVRALLAEDASLRWGDGAPVRAADPEAAAAAAIDAVAAHVEPLLAGVPRRRIEVHGRGATAARVRTRLGTGAAPSGDERPIACVLVTPGSDALAAAARRVADLGTIVLLAEAPDGRAAIDLYPDVHLRSLRLIGVSQPLTHGLPEPLGAAQRLPAPRKATTGLAVPDAAWYRVSASAAV